MTLTAKHVECAQVCDRLEVAGCDRKEMAKECGIGVSTLYRRALPSAFLAEKARAKAGFTRGLVRYSAHAPPGSRTGGSISRTLNPARVIARGSPGKVIDVDRLRRQKSSTRVPRAGPPGSHRGQRLPDAPETPGPKDSRSRSLNQPRCKHGSRGVDRPLFRGRRPHETAFWVRPPVFSQPLCLSRSSDLRLRSLSIPAPRIGRMARPKNASVSTTGSIQLLVASDCEPSLAKSNPNPLSWTRTARPTNESIRRLMVGSTFSLVQNIGLVND